PPAVPTAQPRPSNALLPTALGEQRLALELRALEALHRRSEPARGLGDALGVLPVGGGLADGSRARVGGSSGLKMPEPTNTPSAPRAIISAASAGVAMPPAQKSTTGRRPSR